MMEKGRKDDMEEKYTLVVVVDMKLNLFLIMSIKFHTM
jgi:hypothetical protein